MLANPQQVPLGRLPAHPMPRRLPAYATIELAGEPARLYLRPVPPAGPAGELLVVSQSLEPQEQTLHRLLLALLAVGGGGLVCFLAGVWFLAGRALVPIERAVARQRRFVADASHELRPPLAILGAAAELLEQQRAGGAPAALLGDLRRETAHLERFTADLLTLGRSDLGELGLAVGVFDLRQVVEAVVRRAAPLAQRRGVALAVAPASAELLVEADPDRLEQVLLILLDNALKHTPAGGGVETTARRAGRWAIVEVRDNGEGIAPEHLGRIFARFYRADPARARGRAGLGLAARFQGTDGQVVTVGPWPESKEGA